MKNCFSQFVRAILFCVFVLLISCSTPPEQPSPVVATPPVYATLPPLGDTPQTCQPAAAKTQFFSQDGSDRHKGKPNALGGKGVWVIGIGGPAARITTQYRSHYGYGWKLIWAVDNQLVKGKVMVSGKNLQTNQPFVFLLTGEEQGSITMELDPRHPNHPISVFGDKWSEWGSQIYYPVAGCYELTARWQGGSWSYVLAVGKGPMWV